MLVIANSRKNQRRRRSTGGEQRQAQQEEETDTTAKVWELLSESRSSPREVTRALQVVDKKT